MESSTPVSGDTQFATRLRERGISEIVLIDDAFAPVSRAELLSGELEMFWADIEFNDDARQDLQDWGYTLESEHDLSDELLGELWRRRDKLTALQEAFDTHLRSTLAERREGVEQVADFLEDQLGITVHRLGDVVTTLPGRAQLVFLDFYLGTDGETSVARSEAQAKNIGGRDRAEVDKPLVILMSSYGDVGTRAEDFRERTGLLGGMFQFVPKDDLLDFGKLQVYLLAWSEALPFANDVRRFVGSIERSLPRAARQFIGDIKALRIEDYVHIQSLSLQEDGNPLGDYMLWLYGAHFGHLIFGCNPSVRKHQRGLDRISFTGMVPMHAVPSLKLVEMYRNALFDGEVGEIAPHPRSSRDSNDTVATPYLHLGDLLFCDAINPVWMIANAQCDLQYAPGAKRSFPAEQPVLLLCGRLQPLHEAIASDDKLKPRTELFEHEGLRYRIIWEPGRFQTCYYGQVTSWEGLSGYRRIGRLRLPYALAVQRAFAAELTRVGVPVAPPIAEPKRVRVLCRGRDGKYLTLQEARDGLAFVVAGATGSKCVLTTECLSTLMRGLDRLINEIDAELGTLPTEAAKNLQLKRDRLARILQSPDQLVRVLAPFPLPEFGKEHRVQACGLTISHGAPCSGDFSHRDMLLLDLMQAESSQVTAPPYAGESVDEAGG